MMHLGIINNGIGVIQCLEPVADDDADVLTDAVEQGNFDVVSFLVNLGALTNAEGETAAVAIELQGCDTIGGVYKTLDDPEATINVVLAGGGKTYILEVVRPRNLFHKVKFSIEADTGTFVVDNVLALLTNGRSAPTEYGDTIGAAQYCVSPTTVA